MGSNPIGGASNPLNSRSADFLYLTGCFLQNGLSTRGTYYSAAAKELKITPDSQVKCAVFSYDADKQYIGWSGWSKSEKYTLKDGAVYFRVEAQGDG